MPYIQLSKKKIIPILYGLLILLCSMICGCSAGDNKPAEVDKSSWPLRDNTPKVLTPVADGIQTFTCDSATIDYSHANQGYFCAEYTGVNPKVKLLVKTPDANTYTYTMHGGLEVFPLPAGDGLYSISIYENLQDDNYAIVLSENISVTLEDELLPFLYPNQYVNFTKDSRVVSLAQELCEGAHDDVDVVSAVYEYVKDNIVYDTELAQNISNGQKGYLPDVDSIVESGKGICFDYSAVMVSMLRSQGIPSKLDVGYTGNGATHAWISVYLEDTGWVDGIIEFNGSDWELMDPTLAATKNPEKLKKYIGDGNNYLLKYEY